MRDKQHQKNPTNADLTRKGTTELKRYKKYITPYFSAFVIGPLMMLTEVAGEVMLPKFMSMIINNGVADRNLAYIGKMGTLMVLTVLFMAVGGILGAYFSAKASISFTSDMRNDLFGRSSSSPLRISTATAPVLSSRGSRTMSSRFRTS